MRRKKVSVLGCGWLGMPLVKRLVAVGYEVKGSTTTEDKIIELQKEGVNPFLIDLDNLNSAIACSFLNNSGVVVINVPPRRKIKEVQSYSEVLANLLPFIKVDQKVIFVSSTSVYQNTNDWVDEKFGVFPETESGKAVVEAEKSLQNYLGDRLTIIRFSGLVGKDRHPGRFLAGRKDLPNANAPVNMIHQHDCIGLVIKIIENDFWGEVVNGVASEHPLRKDFYSQASQDLGLVKPTFQEESIASYKLISNTKSVNDLGYQYLFDNPMTMF